ncbi:MAG: hypothetical protein KDB07_13325, partial [Planctomycetes bacterium]|nr:hypothetical protein [Planctomycetota bacterium]
LSCNSIGDRPFHFATEQKGVEYEALDVVVIAPWIRGAYYCSTCVLEERCYGEWIREKRLAGFPNARKRSDRHLRWEPRMLALNYGTFA